MRPVGSSSTILLVAGAYTDITCVSAIVIRARPSHSCVVPELMPSGCAWYAVSMAWFWRRNSPIDHSTDRTLIALNRHYSPHAAQRQEGGCFDPTSGSVATARATRHYNSPAALSTQLPLHTWAVRLDQLLWLHSLPGAIGSA
jgi:dethiobiotin synthetase